VINALQATPRGGSVIISTDMVKADGADRCEIRFSDSGAGIESESLARIFEPFFTTKPDGTGLGLAITRKIIEGHGGTLDVESVVGQGTTVVVGLPLS
jgi:two-component system sensor histidine kinase HydH